MATLTFPYSKNNIYVEAYTPEERAVVKTKTINLYEEYPNIKTLIDNITNPLSGVTFVIYIEPISPNSDMYIKIEGVTPVDFGSTTGRYSCIQFRYSGANLLINSVDILDFVIAHESRPIITLPKDWVVTSITATSK